jgi:ribosomal protein S18 acetylase RimI-like enzyme
VLRQALRRDLPTIVDIWTDAFAGDPYLRWVQPDDTGWPAFAGAWFDFIVTLAFERGHTFITDDDAAAIAWIPPDVAFVTPDDFAHGVALLAAHAGDERGAAAAATIVAAREHLLDEPHWTLQYIGVRSARRNAGLGGAIVTPTLAACDRDGLPCNLVSTNPDNVAFYRRVGFEIVAEAWTPDGAACLRPMARVSSS